MAVTVEQLEIVIEAKIQDALSGLETVQKKLMETASKVAPQFNKQMQSAMSGLASNLVQPLETAQQRMQVAVEKTSEATKKQTNAMIQQQKDIAAQIKHTTEALEKQSTTLTKGTLSQKNADNLPKKTANAASNIGSYTPNKKYLSDMERTADIVADSVGRTFQLMEGMKQASGQVSATVSNNLEIISKKIQTQGALLTVLQEKLARTVSVQGMSQKALQTQMKIFDAEDAIRKLTEQHNKVIENAEKIADAAKRASQTISDSYANAEKAVDKFMKKNAEMQEQMLKGSGYDRFPDEPVRPSKLASQILPNEPVVDSAAQKQAEAVARASQIAQQSVERVQRLLAAMSKTSAQVTGTLAANLENINQRIQAQQSLLEQLREKLTRTMAAEGMSEKTARVQQQLLGAENAMRKLVDQYNKAAESAEDAADSTEEIKDKAGGAERSAKKLPNPFLQAAKATKSIKSGIEKASASTKKFQQTAKTVTTKVEGFFKKLGRAIMAALPFLALAQAFRKFTSFIGEGIKSAINAPEIENMFAVALGNMAVEADKFAKQFRKSLGVDEYATKQMIGTFNNMIATMGIGRQTAYKMSKSLTILANDMASLYNVAPEQAFENLQSAMSGQSEAVRKYGYILNETTIKQVALRHGIIQEGQTLNENQKVLARYLALMEQSTAAQGDMARTIGSLQNQLRILKGNIAAAGRAIGEAFIPFLEAVIPWINAFAIVLQRLGTSLARFTYSLFGRDYDAEKKKQQDALQSAGNIAGGLEDVADAEKDVGKEADKTKKKVQNMLAPFDELYVIQQKMDDEETPENPNVPNLEWDVPTLEVPEGESPLEQLADRIMDKLRDIFKVFRQAWENEGQNTIDAAKYAFESLLEAIKAVGRSFSEVWNNGTGQEFVENILRLVQMILNIIGDIASAFTIAWEKAGAGTALIQQIFDAANAVLELVISIGNAFRAAWNDGRGVEIWDAILSIATNVFAIVENLADRLRAAWEENDNGVKIWGHILDIVQDVLDFLDRITEATANWAAQLDFGPLMSSFENLLGVIEQLVDSILNGLGWAYENVLLPFGTWLVQTAAPAFLDAVAAVLGSSVWQTAAEAIKSLYENALLPLAQWAGDTFTGFLTWIQENGDAVAGIIIAIAAAFAGWAAIQGIVAAVAGAVQLAAGAFIAVQTVAATLSGIISALGATFSFLLSPVGLIIAAVVGLTAEFVHLYNTSDEFRQKVTEAVEKTKEVISSLWENVIKPVFDKIAEVVTNLWQNHLQPLVQKFGEFAQSLGEAALSIYNNFIAPLVGWFLETLGPAISEAIGTILETIGNIVGTIADIAGDVLEILKGVLDFVTGVFTGDWDKAWNGIKEVFTGVWGAISDFFEGVYQTLTGLFGGIIDTVGSAIKKLLEFIGIKDETEEAASDIGESVSEGTAQKIIEQKSVPENAAKEMVESTVSVAETAAKTDAPRIGTTYGNELSSSITQTVPQVEASTTQLTDSITIPLDALIAEGEGTYSTGTSIVQNLAKGITDNLSLVSEAINKLAETIKTAMQQALSLEESNSGNNAFYQYGVSLMQGFAQGISGNVQLVTDTLNQTAESINSSFKELFQIEDYSMVFFNFGMGFMQGLSQGVMEGIEVVREAFLMVGEAINTALNEALAVLGGGEMSEGDASQDFGQENGNAFYQFGVKLMTGLAQGMTETLPVVLETIALIITQIIEAFKVAFVIDEFSQVFLDFGILFMQSLANGIGDSIIFVEEQLESLRQLIFELYEDFMSKFQDTLDTDLTEINQRVSDQMGEMTSTVTSAVDEMISSIASLITQIDAAIAKIRELQAAKASAGGGISSVSTFSANIPQFASGAVLRSPTVGLMAEYAGARSNPEIVTPQNILQETMIDAMFPAVAALSGKLDAVIDAINRIDPSIQIGDDVIYSSSVRGGMAHSRMTGSPAFGY